MNLNDFARIVTLDEGLKKPISIAQVKEVLRIVLSEMAEMPDSEVQSMFKRYKGREVTQRYYAKI